MAAPPTFSEHKHSRAKRIFENIMRSSYLRLKHFVLSRCGAVYYLIHFLFCSRSRYQEPFLAFLICLFDDVTLLVTILGFTCWLEQSNDMKKRQSVITYSSQNYATKIVPILVASNVKTCQMTPWVVCVV